MLNWLGGCHDMFMLLSFSSFNVRCFLHNRMPFLYGETWSDTQLNNYKSKVVRFTLPSWRRSKRVHYSLTSAVTHILHHHITRHFYGCSWRTKRTSRGRYAILQIATSKRTSKIFFFYIYIELSHKAEKVLTIFSPVKWQYCHAELVLYELFL